MTDDPMFRAGVEADERLHEIEQLLTPAGNVWTGLEPRWQVDAYRLIRAVNGEPVFSSPAPLADDGEGEARAAVCDLVDHLAHEAVVTGPTHYDQFADLWRIVDYVGVGNLSVSIPTLRSLLAFARAPATVANGGGEVERAFEAAQYLIDTYERLWKSGVSRDLDEAIGAWDHARSAALSARSGMGENADD